MAAPARPGPASRAGAAPASRARPRRPGRVAQALSRVRWPSVRRVGVGDGARALRGQLGDEHPPGAGPPGRPGGEHQREGPRRGRAVLGAIHSASATRSAAPSAQDLIRDGEPIGRYLGLRGHADHDAERAAALNGIRSTEPTPTPRSDPGDPVVKGPADRPGPGQRLDAGDHGSRLEAGPEAGPEAPRRPQLAGIWIVTCVVESAFADPPIAETRPIAAILRRSDSAAVTVELPVRPVCCPGSGAGPGSA